MEVSAEELGDLARLERDYQPARYPDALVTGTPRGAYDVKDYQRALTTVEMVRARVTAAWGALSAAADTATKHG